QLDLLLSELDELVERFGDARRTTIVADAAEAEIAESVAHENVVIALSHRGYIKRVPLALYRRRVTGGRAAADMDRFGDAFLEHVFLASTADTLVCLTRGGQAHAVKVEDVPEGGRSSRGRALSQILGLGRDVELAAVV